MFVFTELKKGEYDAVCHFLRVDGSCIKDDELNEHHAGRYQANLERLVSATKITMKKNGEPFLIKWFTIEQVKNA